MRELGAVFVRNVPDHDRVGFKVSDRRPQQRDRIAQLPYADVALRAEQPTNQAGLVAVVDVDLPSFTEVIFADSALAALSFSQSINIIGAQPVDALGDVPATMPWVTAAKVLHGAGRRAVLSVRPHMRDVLAAEEADIRKTFRGDPGPKVPAMFVLAFLAPATRLLGLAWAESHGRKFPATTGALKQFHVWNPNKGNSK